VKIEKFEDIKAWQEAVADYLREKVYLVTERGRDSMEIHRD